MLLVLAWCLALFVCFEGEQDEEEEEQIVVGCTTTIRG